ncbi:MAG: hypothetical protein E4G96_02235 [Chrysiogenales bacterium]|nr:MAG: hypothetical protein E4G96_02235 [Chrysiogenales bacterium]
MSTTDKKPGRAAMAILVVPLVIVVAHFLLERIIYMVLLSMLPGGRDLLPINFIIYLRYAILIGIIFWAVLLAYIYVRYGDFKLGRLSIWKYKE